MIRLDSAKKVYMERELTDQQAAPVTARPDKKHNPCKDFNAGLTRMQLTRMATAFMPSSGMIPFSMSWYSTGGRWRYR
jgi:hypothetical protein